MISAICEAGVTPPVTNPNILGPLVPFHNPSTTSFNNSSVVLVHPKPESGSSLGRDSKALVMAVGEGMVGRLSRLENLDLRCVTARSRDVLKGTLNGSDMTGMYKLCIVHCE